MGLFFKNPCWHVEVVISQEDKEILDVYVPNKSTAKYMRKD